MHEISREVLTGTAGYLLARFHPGDLSEMMRSMVARSSGLIVGVKAVTVLYSVLLIPLHVGLLLVASPLLESLWSRRARSLAVSLCVAGGCAGLLLQQMVAGAAAVSDTGRIRATIERFHAGQSDAGMVTVIGDELEKARRELAMMRRAGVYQGAR